ncbi:hypothetical protein ACP70R_011463 [Stipagrostis hirtigluma subsp. patula]
MAVGGLLLPFLLLAVASGSYNGSGQPPISRRSFPEGFIFGTASSSYQYEGGAMEGGKGPSIWDTFTHLHPDKIADGSNGEWLWIPTISTSEDVRIMKDMGMDAYRFSIAWTRIFPTASGAKFEYAVPGQSAGDGSSSSQGGGCCS